MQAQNQSKTNRQSAQSANFIKRNHLIVMSQKFVVCEEKLRLQRTKRTWINLMLDLTVWCTFAAHFLKIMRTLVESTKQSELKFLEQRWRISQHV